MSTFTREQVAKGVHYYEVSDTTATAKTARSLVPAKAGYFGVVTKLLVSSPTAITFSLVYGATTIFGPFHIAAKRPMALPDNCSIMGRVVNTTIKYATVATATISLWGHFHYEQRQDLPKLHYRY